MQRTSLLEEGNGGETGLSRRLLETSLGALQAGTEPRNESVRVADRAIFEASLSDEDLARGIRESIQDSRWHPKSRHTSRHAGRRRAGASSPASVSGGLTTSGGFLLSMDPKEGYVSAEFELEITAGFTFKSAQATHAHACARACTRGRMWHGGTKKGLTPRNLQQK